MTELEALTSPGTRHSPFSQYVNDLSPTEAKVVHEYFDRIRAAMLAHLRACEIRLEVRPTSLRWAIECGISFMRITVEELGPSKLGGYGPLKPEAEAQSTKIREDLARLVDQVARYLRQGIGRDLHERLARLDQAQAGVETLSVVEQIVTRWQLVEFRPTIAMIVGRLEAPSFEIAVFGRVSSGKSSLLNRIADIDALPVGVTPVTAVPTRMVAGDVPSVVVSFAETKPSSVGLEHLWEYASEEGNPGNCKHVTNILVKLPSARLQKGIVFVDTPGLGSLALAGGAETWAYLPRCDLAVVLVDAASTLNQEDLALVRRLYENGAHAMVLLSKADLLTPADRKQMTDYIQDQLRRQLGLELPVHPVSTIEAEQSLLTAWLDNELAPRFVQHRALTEGSIHRKIALVVESVIATLETIQARRIDLYEAQAGVFREQLRPLSSDRGEAGNNVDNEALETDLSKLREAVSENSSGWHEAIAGVVD
jgi:GTP-binding protein EngB required for normal cell division